MKKIMKKALSLALALVMMLSLAPMTAKADDALADGATQTVYPYPSGNAAGVSCSIAAGATVTFNFQYLTVGPGGAEYKLKVTGASNEFSVNNVPINNMGYTANYTPTNKVASGVAFVDYQGNLTVSLKNTASEVQDFSLELSIPVGTANNPEPIYDMNVTDGVGVVTKEVTFTAADQPYYYVIQAPANGKLGVSNVTSTGAWYYEVAGTMCTSYDDPLVTSYLTDVEGYQDVVIAVGACDSDATVSVTIRFEEKPAEPGEKASTALSVVEGKEYTNVFDSTYYKYKAEADGALTVAVTDYMFMGVSSLNGNTEVSVDDYVTTDTGLEMQLEKDDEVIFYVYGEVDVTKTTIDFEADKVVEKPVDEIIYEASETPLVVGEKVYDLSDYEYTVFTFEPTETGVYTITTTNAVMGNLGAQVLDSLLNTSVVKETTITVECKEVGPSWKIAVAGSTNKANIKITKAGEAQAGPGYSVYTMGVGLITPDAYTYEGDVADLKVVNHKDDVIDKAVMGSDSFYHLNSADGPILYVDLDDSTVISLYDVFVNGGMKAVYYNADGSVAWVDDYSSAFNYYYEYLADKETKMYPLTEALMEMIKSVGNTKGKDWFDKTNQYGVKSDKEDAWMFCCYYNEDITTGEAPYTIPPVYANSFVEDFKKPVVDKEAMEILVDLNKTQPVSVFAFVDDEGDEIVTFTFAPNTLKLVDGMDKYDFSVEIVKDADKVENDKVTKDNFVLRINFAYSGQLPAEATITIPVPADIAKEYDVLYYYQIMEDGSLEYVCDAPVEGGVATVKQDHCSDYVLLTEKLPEDDAAKTAPKTGDSSNIALWVAVLGLGVVAIAGSVVMKKREF